MHEYCQDKHYDGETFSKHRTISKGRADSRILIATLLLLIAVFYVYVASAVPASTYVSPTLPDNSTTNYSWVFVNVTSSEPLAVAYLEWGNSSGFTNVSMLNNTATNWYKNMTDLVDGVYNYTVYAQNTTGSWNQSARRFVTVDAVSPYGISSCQNLSVPGGYYALAQNVSSAGTCFTIGADNITLDGQGYAINYSQSQAGHAVDDSLGYYNATIKNLIITNTSIAGSHAIYGVGMRNSTIRNNTITASAYDAYGISLISSDANAILNNTITTSGSSGHSIYLNFSSSNTVSNNTITTGGDSGHGIYLNSSGSSVISSNRFIISGSYGRGIYINSSTSNYVYNNNITTIGIMFETGIYVMGSNSTTISNNNVDLSSAYASGIYLFSSNSSSLSGNVISGNGNAGSVGGGIYLDVSNLNTISNNTVTTVGDGFHGLRFKSGSDLNAVSRNVITTSGNAYGVLLDTSDSNTLSNNTVLASDFYSIAVISSSSNNITGGSIRSIASYDYYLQDAGTSNNFTETNFTALRKIYATSTDSSFNYNNQTDGSIWLKTNVSLAGYISRTLTTWSSALLRWNDTNSTAGMNATYRISGLTASMQYVIYNTSGDVQSTSYNLTTDVDGNLPAFAILLKANTDVIVMSASAVPLEITLQSPSNMTYPQKWAWANVSLNKAGDWCGVSLNGTENRTLSNTSALAWWLNLSVPSDGLNNVTFYCNDTVGNMTQSATRSFTIDTVHPLITIQSPLNTTYPQKWVWANLTLNELGNWCGASLNEGTNQTLTNSTGNWWLNLSVPVEGLNNVTFYCNDTGGNMNSSSVVFTIDTVPSITVLSPAINATYAQKWVWANVSLSESGSWCGVSLNGTTNQTLTNSTGKWWMNLSVPVEGLNNVTFYCNDTIGNMVQSATRNFTIDTANPIITIQSPLNITYSQAWVWANVSLNEAGSCDVSLNGTANQTMSNISTTAWYLYLPVPSEGQNNVTFYCNDTAGNTNSSSVVFTVSVIPEITILSPSANANYTQNLIWANVSLNESGSWCGVSLNGTTNQTLTNSTGKWWLSLSVQSEGPHNVTFYCNDTIGNMVQSATRNFTIDTIPPLITFAGQTPNNNEVVNRSYAFINVTASETLSVALLEWNLTANQTMQGVGTGWYINKTDLANGNYTFRVYVNDTHGNRNATEQRWVYINFTNTTTYTYNFTLGNSTGGTISNASLQIYTDTADVLSDFRFNSSTTSAGVNLSMGVKYHVKYSLPAGVILDIKNITINATTTISPQFVDSYTGSLPASTSAKSYAIALNDSTLSYGYAELTFPITGTVNRVLHCLAWNFTLITCSSWESNALSSYSYRLNSTHLVFNVTSFDAYMAGYYEAAATPTPIPSTSISGGSSSGGSSADGTVSVTPTANKTVHAKALGPFAAFEAIISESAAQNPEIKATELLALPFGVIQPAGVPYLYAEITSNFNTSAYLKEARIDFKVNKSWYSNNNVSPASTKLLRYTGKYWQSLPTVMNGDDETAYSFSANTTAFSTFAIVGIKNAGPARATTATAAPTQTPTAVVAPSPTPTATPSVGGLTKVQSLMLILLLLFVIIVAHMFLEKGESPAQPTLEECLDEVKEEIHPPSEDENEDRPKEPEPEPDDNVEKG